MKRSAHRWLCLLLSVLMLLNLLAGCGQAEEEDEEDEEEHTCEFGEWEVKKPATCTEAGQEVRTCSDCDEEETRELPKLEHSYTAAVTTPATCRQEGVTTYTCACGDSYTEPLLCPTYESTQVHDLYVDTVGEVETFDRQGNGLSLGTCFVYAEDGKLLTNYHVIEDSYSIKVTLAGTSYTVSQVLAYDKNIDLAVLKIDATGLKPATICMEEHKTGEVVYAFGSSRGLTATFSDGMITQAIREIDGVVYTQHDAPISGGNSGGPLINSFGEVVGINTWTVIDSQNLNFAIHPTELNNLDYSTPMTPAQVYEAERDPYDLLAAYLVENGTLYDGYYALHLGDSYPSDYSATHSRMAYYYYDQGFITLDLLVNDGERWAYFTIEPDATGIYEWSYFDDYDIEIEGTFTASRFNDNTLLPYTDHNVSSPDGLESIRSLSSAMLLLLMSHFNEDFASIGLTAADLGFTYF